MALKEYKVEDVKCVDVDGKIKGVSIACTGRTYISLMFPDSLQHEKTDELVHLLEKMQLTKIEVQQGN